MSRHYSRQSKTFLARRRMRSVIFLVGSIIVIVGIVYGLSLLSSIPFFTITNVEISGTTPDKVNPINTLVLGEIQGKYFGLFSKANSFLYPGKSIENKLKSTYIDVDSVAIDRSDRYTLAVSVKEKTPAAIICTTLPDFNDNELTIENSDSCYFADSTGLIFKKAPSFSGQIYHRYYFPDLTDSTVPASSTGGVIGSYATSTPKFLTIQNIYSELERNQITTTAVLLKDNGEYEMYVRNPGPSQSTAVIYFTTNSSTTAQLSNLISFWAHSIQKGREQNKIPEFEYIDVRYGDNVFFREVK